MPRETREQKAMRLIAEQRLRFTHISATGCVVIVRGDSGDYVVRLAGRWECTCEQSNHTQTLCSHRLAARTIYRAVVAALGGK